MGFERKSVAGYEWRRRGAGAVQRHGNVVTHVGIAVQGTRQRRGFENRHAGFGGDFANAQGDLVGALGDDARCAHFAVAVGQRHGVVGRVGDDHIGLRHFGHHAAAGHLALLLADAALDVRVAFGLARLALDFLEGHLQARVVFPDRQRHVDGGDDDGDQGQRAEHADDHLAGAGHGGRQRGGGQAGGLCAVIPDEPAGHAGEEQRLDDGLGDFAHAGEGEHALEGGHRRQALGLGLHGAGGEHPAAHGQRAGNRGDRGDGNDGRCQQNAVDGHGEQALGQRTRGEDVFALQAQAGADQAARGFEPGRATHPQGTGH